jgi:hypothetical protein
MTIAIRFAIAAIAALSFAAVPIYPGATLDAAASKEATARTPGYPVKVYETPDSYEKVVAFYKSKGAAQSNVISDHNTAQQKMAMFSASDSTIGINWPAEVKDKTGKVVSKTGTRIAITS